MFKKDIVEGKKTFCALRGWKNSQIKVQIQLDPFADELELLSAKFDESEKERDKKLVN